MGRIPHQQNLLPAHLRRAVKSRTWQEATVVTATRRSDRLEEALFPSDRLSGIHPSKCATVRCGRFDPPQLRDGRLRQSEPRASDSKPQTLSNSSRHCNYRNAYPWARQSEMASLLISNLQFEYSRLSEDRWCQAPWDNRTIRPSSDPNDKCVSRLSYSEK